MNNLKNIALVTGASSGIGRSIALRLARDGFYCLVHYHSNEKGAETTVREIEAHGGRGETIGFDVCHSHHIESTLQDWFGRRPEALLRVLVNNAGIHEDSLAGILSDEAFDRVIQTNLNGPFYLMRFAVRRMMRERAGCIINIASISGQIGNPGQINYSASKAGLIAMTKTLAAEIGPRGVRVNAVAPGLIEAGMLGNESTGIPEATLLNLKTRIPLRRLGRAEEVAGAVSFLASEDASSITGHTLYVNGGLFPA